MCPQSKPCLPTVSTHRRTRTKDISVRWPTTLTAKTQKLTTQQPIVTATSCHCGPQVSRHNNQCSRHNSQFSRHNTEFHNIFHADMKRRDPKARNGTGDSLNVSPSEVITKICPLIGQKWFHESHGFLLSAVQKTRYFSVYFTENVVEKKKDFA